MQQNISTENDFIQQNVNDNNGEINNIEEKGKKDDINDEPFNDIDDEIDDAEKNDDEISISPILDTGLNTETSRYLQIFHKGKELAKLASPDSVICSRVLEILQREVNKIMNISFNNIDLSRLNEEKNQMPIQDALAKLKELQKRKKPKETNTVDRNEQPTCAICTFHHQTGECHFFNKMQEFVRKNKVLNMNSDGRRCSLCIGLNHQNRNCSLRIEDKEYYEGKKLYKFILVIW